MKKEKDNWKDTYRGVVHLSSGAGGWEFTLCGFAFDEPASEYGADAMTPTNAVATCPHCLEIAEWLLPYLKKEMERVSRKEKTKQRKYTCVKCGRSLPRSAVKDFDVSCSVRRFICKQCANEEGM